eukprot:TRINITY_DN5330_c1_g1_i3.p1 TRINITY_DN5330_c1_g1~~TRINITY_DN5330_c1_g1_i3.p1  ORF type:complete len:258 (+),score=40.58 TRINITY_DN5330_c1_g1_i3:78-851(+)
MWPTPESIFLILIASICGHCLTLNVTQVTYRNGGLWHYPTGIDYHSPTNSIITSAYTDNLGQPCNLMRLDALGNQIPYSNLTMVPGEVMFHIVRPSPGPWTPGDVFVGSVFFTSISNLSKALSPNGYIIRVADLGQTVIKPWCQFPPGVYRIIALTIDETGVFNYSMIVGADLTGLIYRVEYGNDTVRSRCLLTANTLTRAFRETSSKCGTDWITVDSRRLRVQRSATRCSLVDLLLLLRSFLHGFGRMSRKPIGSN